MKIATNILAVIFLTLSGVIYSQNKDNAIMLLDDVNEKIDKYTSLKLEFTMFVENGQNGERFPYPGNAIYKDGNYKLDMMGQIIFSDGKTNWTYLKDIDEVNITNNSSNEEILSNPKNIFKNYKEDFKVTQISDKFEKNRPLVEIDLYPKKIEDKKYSRITLKVDKTKKQIYSIRYIGKDGISYLIELNKFIENPAIENNEINYNDNLFPDAEIVDMRD
ncbi:outer membrane lipoprotein carrier protein LolA [Bacteroidales bacterium OttesenSCG-928-I21]|nr:outer membrane lipoprotein carrier protein LolA [Bacteroidales bacterium OttesenSCG-928-I21]